MRHPILIVCAVSASVAAFQGCFYDLPTIQEIDPSGSGGDGRSSSSTSSGVSSSSSTSGGVSSSSGAPGSSSSSGKPGSSSSSSSGDPGSSSSSSSSSSGGTGAGLIVCGVDTCKRQAPEICCTNQAGISGCVPEANCTSAGQTIVACDGPEDCPVGICCGLWDGNRYTRVGCLTVCDAPHFPICHLNAMDPGCPGTKVCKPEVLLGPTYGYCE